MPHPPPDQPPVTIITVVRNDADGLLRTAASLRGQSCRFEWLVLDGGSTDGTADTLPRLSPRPDWSRSHADDGPFAAMNEGLARARGRHVLFLNAGDWLLAGGLDRLLAAADGRDDVLAYGDSVEDPGDGRLRLKPARNAGWAWYGMPAHHCAILYPAAVARRLRYRSDLRIASDYGFTLEALKLAGYVRLVRSPVAGFAPHGRSRTEADRGRAEQDQVRRQILCVPSSVCTLIRATQEAAAMLRKAYPSIYARIRFGQSFPDAAR